MEPVNFLVSTGLEYPQKCFSAGLSPSTLKVYMAAIAAYHAFLGGQSLGKDPLITHFLRGTLSLRSAQHSKIPTWDWTAVLYGLCNAPFETFEEIPDMFLTLKTVFNLDLSSLKSIGYL